MKQGDGSIVPKIEQGGQVKKFIYVLGVSLSFHKWDDGTVPLFQREDKVRRKARKLDEILEIPVVLSTNNPKITIVGFERVLIENYRGILEYQDYFVRLNTYIGIININGFNLNLEEMTTDDLLVTGKIDSIDFESTTEEEVEEEK